MPDCNFCERVSKAPQDQNLIVSTDYWSVFLNPDQSYLGRTIIIANRHIPSLAKRSEEEVRDEHIVIRTLDDAITQAFGATMFNLTCLMNEAYDLKKYPEGPNPHVHLHFRPRYNKPISFARETFTDNDFGKNFNATDKRDLSEHGNILKKIGTEIRKYL